VQAALRWAQLARRGTVQVRDLWAGKEIGAMTGRVTAQLAPHASALYRLKQG
jgi:hypothetical protein